MSKEAMKLALEAFKDLEKHRCLHYPNIVKALEEALAKQEQGEPVAKVCHDLDGHIGWNPSLTELPDEGTPLYTTPQQREPLTDKQLNIIGSRWHLNLLGTDEKAELFAFARAIEAAHGIKGEV